MKDKDLTLYDQLFDAQSKMHDIWKRNELQYEGEYPIEYLTKANKLKRKTLFVPKTRNVINIVKAIFSTAFFSSGLPIELVPQSEEERDLVVKRNKVLKYAYKKLKPNKELGKAFLSALLYRMGIVITYYDKSRKKVITRFIPITDIAFDNECSGIDDIQCIAYRSFESKMQILANIDSGFYNQKNLKEKLDSTLGNEYSKRYKIKTIYKRKQNYYISKTFINGVLVRKQKFKKLPFQFGYAIEKLPSVDDSIREEQILCYGWDLATFLKPMQEEINHKRNVKDELLEEKINPSYFSATGSGLDGKDLKRGPSKKINVKNLDKIKKIEVQGDYEIITDLDILDSDVRDATGVNSVQEGRTTSSDRRSATAISYVTSNSSMRIEEMLNLMNDTLFEHWAKTWVELVMKNTDDSVINRVTQDEYPFGRKGQRKDFDFDLEINFGMTIDTEKKINDLIGLLQVIIQNPKINPKVVDEIIHRIVNMRMGEDTNLDDLILSEETSQEDIEKESLSKGSL